MQRDLAALHDRPHGDSEILAAFLFRATEHAGALGSVGMIYDAAVRADRTIGPQRLFEIDARRVVIAEVGG